jgi:lactam utilization protein B
MIKRCLPGFSGLIASDCWMTSVNVACGFHAGDPRIMVRTFEMARAFSSEVDTGSREENASKQESGASVLIQSDPEML